MHSSPAALARFIATPPPERIPTGLDALNNAFRGWLKQRRNRTRELLELGRQADRLANNFKSHTDAALHQELARHKAIFRRHGFRTTMPDELAALAVLSEASSRAWGLRPFPVQLAGAVGLSTGCLIEMATGEGKTLVAALAAVLAAWRGGPCHVVTVNDYLARRDSANFARIASWVGATTAAVTGPMTPRERQAAYQADVVYTTSKELLADYLRDRLAMGEMDSADRLSLRQLVNGRPLGNNLVQRGLRTAIVDEADSVLIDDAVTPLIISRTEENEDLRRACEVAHGLAGQLLSGRHYRVDPRARRVDLTPEGENHLTELSESLPALWRGADRRRELVERALEAKSFFFREQQYVVEDGKVTIVDELSGRLMPQRTWREGLHQAIEAREGLNVTSPSTTLARMSFQRFFRLFPHLSGMTGTASEAAAEFWQIYRLTVVPIPTNRPVVRRREGSLYYRTATEKWGAVLREIQTVHGTGRPVLVGARSIEESETLAENLRQQGLYPSVLNARQHEQEASIIALAGQKGAITIATNMAGRGADICLGAGVAALGGLHVVSCARHASGRVDRQLLGRAGRQGDPGSGRFFASAQDELLERSLPRPVKLFIITLGTLPKLERALLPLAFNLAQWFSDRRAYRQRRLVLRNDQWLEDSLGFTGSSRL